MAYAAFLFDSGSKFQVLDIWIGVYMIPNCVPVPKNWEPDPEPELVEIGSQFCFL